VGEEGNAVGVGVGSRSFTHHFWSAAPTAPDPVFGKMGATVGACDFSKKDLARLVRLSLFCKAAFSSFLT
jgi:hypothetical protein